MVWGFCDNTATMANEMEMITEMTRKLGSCQVHSGSGRV